MPVSVLLTRETLFSGTGALAAAIAIGAFLGQGLAVAGSVIEERRRVWTAIGGLIGVAVMIGLILFSTNRG